MARELYKTRHRPMAIFTETNRDMYKIGQKVQQEFSGQVMEIVGFEPELIENIITRWEDEDGNLITAKFSESALRPLGKSQTSNG